MAEKTVWWQQDGKISREVIEENRTVYFTGWCWSGKLSPDGRRIEFNFFTEETRLGN